MKVNQGQYWGCSAKEKKNYDAHRYVRSFLHLPAISSSLVTNIILCNFFSHSLNARSS
jgi:hypothetical protein